MSGEKQNKEEYIESVAKAREEVAVKNINSIAEFAQGTRKMARESQSEVKQLKIIVAQQNMKIQELEGLIRKFLIDNYSGGVTTE